MPYKLCELHTWEKNLNRYLCNIANMTLRPFLGVLCPSCLNHNNKPIEDILHEAPDSPSSHMDIFSNQRIRLNIVKSFSAQNLEFLPPFCMRECLRIHLALFQMDHALSGFSLPGYAVEDEVSGLEDLKALRVTSLAYSQEIRFRLFRMCKCHKVC